MNHTPQTKWAEAFMFISWGCAVISTLIMAMLWIWVLMSIQTPQLFLLFAISTAGLGWVLGSVAIFKTERSRRKRK